jgi:alpha-tubulin suppressor-like RCC1 family protein
MLRMKLGTRRRGRAFFLTSFLLVVVATGCSAILGDFEVGAGPSTSVEAGGDVAVDAPTADGSVPLDAAMDGTDAADAGCKIPTGGVVLDDAVTVAAGSTHTCAIRQDGALYCWGANNFGQLGVPQATALSSGKPIKVEFPASLGTARITQVAISELTTFAVDSQLRLWAWGDNEGGLLAIGSTDAVAHDAPAIVKTGATSGAPPLLVRSVAPLWFAACALGATGDVYCWGKNSVGELGASPPAPALGVDSFVPGKAFSLVTSPGPNAILAAGVGSADTCYASGATNDMICWGGAFSGGLLSNVTPPPNGGVNYSAHTTLVTAGATMPMAQISYGTNYGGALDSKGRLFTWGSTDNAQHGAGGAPAAGTAKVVPGVWTNMSTGYVFLCAVDDMKNVRCRGSNTQMQLGRVATTVPATQLMDPVVLGSGSPLTNVRSVHAGFFHACAILEGACGPKGPGAVKCWGQGTQGELGDGNATSSIVPVDVKAP